VLISSFFFLNYIDYRMKIVLRPFLDYEVERFTTVIVSEAFNELKMDYSKDSFFTVEYDDYGKFEKISYNTIFMNQLSNEFSNLIQEKLENMEIGKIENSILFQKEKRGKFHHIHDGILCEVSFGSLRGSTLFSNVGPVIPIRLLYLGHMNPDIDVKVTEYGVNNLLLEIDFVATIKEQISMPFSSNQKEIKIRQPLVIDIIRGEIPNYYHEVSK